MARTTSHLPDQPYARSRIRCGFHDANVGEDLDLHLSTGNSIAHGANGITTLAVALWPLVIHGILIILATSLMIFYINAHSFNLDERRPGVSLADGTRFPLSRWTFLQSDITTFIPIFSGVLRWVVTAWVGPLLWRCTFILLETTGLRADQLYYMISYSIPVLLRARPLQLALWIVLAFTLPVYLVAPVLTGSVTWRPSLIVVAAPPGSTIHIPHVAGPQAPQRWSDWTTQDFWREQITRQAIGLANIAWWRGSLNNSSKRILANSANLSINSTINNVTLPYLHVSALEWIPNPEVVLTPAQLDLRKTVCANITLSLNSSCPLFFDLGAAGFVQDAPYAWGSELLPSASMMTETRLLVLYGAWRNDWSRPCEPRYINRQISKDFPENATFYPDDLLGQCWLFARVTYTAGVGTCSDCRISAYRTVQADDMDKLQDIRGDYMTSPALSMVPTVIGTLVGMNVSVPEAWESLDNYVAEFLRRSYAVSWAALTNFVGEFDPQLNTTYKVALPASKAQVNEKRVYIWLGIQLLITLSGLLFLTVQANLETPIMIDTTLAPFYLDSSELYEPENYQSLSDGALLRLRYEDGHMKVKIE